jgi:hypothetical protein
MSGLAVIYSSSNRKKIVTILRIMRYWGIKGIVERRNLVFGGEVSVGYRIYIDQSIANKANAAIQLMENRAPEARVKGFATSIYSSHVSDQI